MIQVTETRDELEFIFIQEADYVVGYINGSEISRDHKSLWEKDQKMMIDLSIAEYLDNQF
ncbi:MAG: hypothetical protein A2X18_07650 [Bacteroidetes bacterium GWF2_40_14]|nr:MAG: hypothetical protein A2X18_07650 [Bacteroidetes bacterium GWF2_40_14]